MIIRILGGNGAGKSHLVRSILDECAVAELRLEGCATTSARPRALLCSPLRPGRSFVTMGHYEIANGGLDTIPSKEEAYRLIRLAHQARDLVLYESNSMSDGARRTLELHREGFRLIIVNLSTSLEECVQSVRERGHNIRHQWIQDAYDKAWRLAKILDDMGIRVFHLDRSEAHEHVRSLLRGPR